VVTFFHFNKLAIALPSLRTCPPLGVFIVIGAIVLLYTAALSFSVVYIQSIGSFASSMQNCYFFMFSSVCGFTRTQGKAYGQEKNKSGIVVFSGLLEPALLLGFSSLPVIKPEKSYDDAYTLKSVILKENQNKSGIYKFTNKLNGNFYIGSNLSKRFYKYFNLSYISDSPQ
jgi:hypothetical protein